MQVDINFTPPRFAALIWHDRGNRTWIDMDIDRNPGFWRFWSLGRLTLPQVGVYVTKLEGDWCVIFNPTQGDFELADLERVVAEISAAEAALPKILFDGEEPENAAQAAQARRDLLSIHDSKWSVERGLAIQADAQALISEWGDFASDHRRLREILAAAPSTLSSTYAANDIRAARKKTEKRAAARLAKARLELDVAGDDAVGWTDDEVMRAVRFLTVNDFDHAAIANDRGWSSADSAAGHWCAKMLKDPEHSHIALATARGLVGKYCRQLVTSGIIPRDRVLLPPKQKRKAA